MEEAELIALGQARRSGLGRLLAGREPDPARVFIAAGQSPVTKNGVLRMELRFK